MGDEGAFPVRSVEKGDRGGYGVVAWVYGGTGSCREMSEAGERLEEGMSEEKPKRWREMNDEIRRGPGKYDRERKYEHEWK